MLYTKNTNICPQVRSLASTAVCNKPWYVTRNRFKAYNHIPTLHSFFFSHPECLQAHLVLALQRCRSPARPLTLHTASQHGGKKQKRNIYCIHGAIHLGLNSAGVALEDFIVHYMKVRGHWVDVCLSLGGNGLVPLQQQQQWRDSSGSPRSPCGWMGKSYARCLAQFLRAGRKYKKNWAGKASTEPAKLHRKSRFFPRNPLTCAAL